MKSYKGKGVCAEDNMEYEVFIQDVDKESSVAAWRAQSHVIFSKLLRPIIPASTSTLYPLSKPVGCICVDYQEAKQKSVNLVDC